MIKHGNDAFNAKINCKYLVHRKIFHGFWWTLLDVALLSSSGIFGFIVIKFL